MADPFEVRMRFTSQLQHLNASVNSSQKAAQYALKYKDMDEDLHSCIIEQIEKNSLNNRANIMYFLEHLCDIAVRDGHRNYVRMIERDILQIVDAVAPDDGSGAANIRVVRRVLKALSQKKHLKAETAAEIEECLNERDTTMDHAAIAETLSEDVEKAGISSQKGSKSGGVQRFDKKQIEQRIEEDRERHKRLRESIWAIDHKHESEFEKMWDETSDICDDDYDLFEEEYQQRKAAAAIHSDQFKTKPVVNGK